MPEQKPRIYQIGQEKIIFKLTAADTGGRFSTLERVVAARFQSPPQFHAQKEGWSCFLLQGELKFHFLDRSQSLTAGEIVYVPEHTFFRWENPTDQPALALFTYSPAGFEEFFAEIANHFQSQSARIDDYQDTLNFILKIQDKYGMYRKPE